MASGRIGFVSLGCPKALVDSERIITQLRAEGYDIAPRYEGADLVVVNTCGFIEDAVAESMDAIAEAMAKNGKVIVTGCLGARAEEVHKAYPDVLAVTGPHATEAVMKAVHEQLPAEHDPYMDLVPPQGIKLTPRHYAYLKISEGCNHRCSFCIIPSFRGDLVSRPLAEVLQEAENLVQAGVKELLVISQDTSAYGVDTKYKTDFWNGRPVKTRIIELARELGQLGVWNRLHYVYPYPHVDELIPLMQEGMILPYLDVPFQHASTPILKAMKRPGDTDRVLQRIHGWRAHIPELVIRSTFIVGFPGETENDFQKLLDFITEAQLDRVGAFAYSPVEGAAANALPGQVPDELKAERLQQFMHLQEKISAAKLQKRIGEQTQVIVDSVEDGRVYARSWAEAPDVDGYVLLQDDGGTEPGSVCNVVITGAGTHDLTAEKLPD